MNRKKILKILAFLFGIGVLYFLLRVPNLTLQPIFADEAIYIRWAQVAQSEPSLRFIPLQDGKTPLFMWAMIPLFKVFDDPLFAGRFLAVISGVFTLIGVFLIGFKFISLRVGIWASLLIAITPFIVFFDRMALVDSMLAAFSVWALFFALWLIKKPSLGISFLLGYAIGGAMLTKPPGLFNLITLPVTILALFFKDEYAKSPFLNIEKSQLKRLFKLFIFWAIAAVTAMVLYNILRLGPGFENLSSRSQDYIHSPTRLLQYPFDPFIPHLKDLADWFPKLLTWPILLTGIGGAIMVIYRRIGAGLVILAWLLIPVLLQMFLLQTFTARYILPSIPFLLILSAWFLDEIYIFFKNRFNQQFSTNFVVSIILVVLFVQPIYFAYYLITDPQKAPLPKGERRGYLEDWTAGYGFKDIALYLSEKSRDHLVVIGTEGYFGTLPDGLWIYLNKQPNIAIKAGKAEITDDLRGAAKDHPTYFVANKQRFPQPPKDLELISEYPKAIGADGSRDAIMLYKFIRE